MAEHASDSTDMTILKIFDLLFVLHFLSHSTHIPTLTDMHKDSPCTTQNEDTRNYTEDAGTITIIAQHTLEVFCKH